MARSTKFKIYYALFSVLVVVGFYIWENYIDQQKFLQNAEPYAVPGQDQDSLLLPHSTTRNVVYHKHYTLSYHETYEQSEWVAYRLDKSHIVRTQRKRPFFEMDPGVSTQSAHWKNYKKSGYDRGHLCPAGDRRFSEAAYTETFLTSNCSPQLHGFNSGIWNSLEQQARRWAQQYGSVYVITGGVLTPGLDTIGEERVAVPNYYYKILYRQQNGTSVPLAFLFPHREASAELELSNYLTTVDQIEQLTGIDFFPLFADSDEAIFEAKGYAKDWEW